MVIWPLEIILYFSIFRMKGKMLCYKIVYIYMFPARIAIVQNLTELSPKKNHNKCKRQ